MIAAGLLTLLLCVADAAKFSLPLAKIESRRTQLMREGKWSQVIAEKRQLAKLGKLGKRQPIYDYMDAEYCVKASVGTPPQEFLLLLDTAVSPSWVPAESCGGTPSDCAEYCKGSWCDWVCDERCCVAPGPSGCTGKAKFNPANSSTYTASNGYFLQVTSVGRVEGTYAIDNWQVGTHDADALNVSAYKFGYITKLGLNYQYVNHGGVLGLGRSKNPKSIITQAIEQKQLDEPLVALHLKEEGADHNGVVGGQIVFGGVDNDNCGLVTEFVNTTTSYDWSFRIGAVNLNGQVVHGGSAVSDTSSVDIYGPYYEINTLAQSVGAIYDYENDVYTVACSVDFKFAVQIGKNFYPVDKRFLVRHAENGRCVLALRTTDYYADSHDWVLGVPFAQQYCHVFDYTGAIGFAKIRNN